MKTDVKSRSLDPKLRRLAAAEPERLRADLARDVLIAGGEILAEGPVPAADVTTRVMVRLTADRPPPGFDDLHWVPIVDRIHTVAVPVDRLEELGASPDVEYVEAGRELAPSLSTSVAETRADRVRNGNPGADGTGVLVGIIDFGIDFTLDDFRNDDGTSRIAFLWDQSLTAQDGEAAPAPFGYGVEYDRAALDAALAGNDPFAAIRHQPGARSHGTHVAGTAAGSGRSGDAAFPAGSFVGVAPGATLIFVQPDASDQTTTFTDSVHVAEAIAYVLARADELGMPCVINISLGQNGGSHDGESLVERAIDRLLEQPGRAMTVAAGNEHIWRGHAGGQLAEGDLRTLAWGCGGGMPLPGGGALPGGFGDFTPNEMEIWYSSRDVFRVRVIDPDGVATAIVEPGETEAGPMNNDNQDVVFIDSERFTVLNGDSRIYVEISPPPGQFSRVTAGIWQVEIEAVEVRDGRFDAWIERDARRASNDFADQSFFAGADFDQVRTQGTPATGRRSISVANYDHVVQSPSSSSGRGATRDAREKPEVAAPGTAIRSSCSLGGRPDPDDAAQILPMRTEMSGTSMAAPHVAGIAALLFEVSPRLTADQVRKLLIASATPVPGVTHFDDAWGFGKVDAEAAVDLVR